MHTLLKGVTVCTIELDFFLIFHSVAIHATP